MGRGASLAFGIRRRLFGPGLILAIVLSVFVWARSRPDLTAPGDRPIVERAKLSANRPTGTPDVSELLKHADALALTPRQRKAVGRLVKQWAPESAERRQDMTAAVTAFNDAMGAAVRRGKAGLDEIYRNAGEASTLTSQWLARKADFWQRGLAELTLAQRQRVKALIPERGVCRDLAEALAASAPDRAGEAS